MKEESPSTETDGLYQRHQYSSQSVHDSQRPAENGILSSSLQVGVDNDNKKSKTVETTMNLVKKCEQDNLDTNLLDRGTTLNSFFSFGFSAETARSWCSSLSTAFAGLAFLTNNTGPINKQFDEARSERRELSKRFDSVDKEMHLARLEQRELSKEMHLARLERKVLSIENKRMTMRLEKIDGTASDDEREKTNRKMSVIQAEINGLEEDIRRAEQDIEHEDIATAVYEPPSDSFV